MDPIAPDSAQFDVSNKGDPGVASRACPADGTGATPFSRLTAAPGLSPGDVEAGSHLSRACPSKVGSGGSIELGETSPSHSGPGLASTPKPMSCLALNDAGPSPKVNQEAVTAQTDGSQELQASGSSAIQKGADKGDGDKHVDFPEPIIKNPEAAAESAGAPSLGASSSGGHSVVVAPIPRSTTPISAGGSDPSMKSWHVVKGTEGQHGHVAGDSGPSGIVAMEAELSRVKREVREEIP